MMIEAMIEGGMKEGMTREMAKTFVCQAMIGATGMVMETSVHPNDLRDAVCSPNGTTIEAVNYLRDNDLGGIVQNAMKACADRSREMAKISAISNNQ
jgi:pyrroline-5-carboxylate reductase